MTTPAPSLQSSAITFPFNAQQRSAYYARPDAAGPHPGVIVIHEIYGLNDNIKAITRRFAAAGYAALAVDLFADRSRVACMFNLLRSQLFASLKNAYLSELQSALTYLAAQPEVAGDQVGVIGFCMGGGFAISWACTDPRLKVSAPFYGSNPRPLGAAQRACPIVGSYPEKDFTKGAGEKLDSTLTQYNIPHDIKIYPNAHHSFFNDQGQAYDATAAEDSWQRVIAFFGEHLRGSTGVVAE